jgi:hypothetical protein
MFGIPVTDTCDVFCDNQAVVFHSSIPQSTLAKKHNAICFHMAKVQSEFNLADGFTKSLPTPLRHFIFTRLLLSPQWTDGESAMTGFMDEDLRDDPDADVSMPMERDDSDD